MPNGLSIPPDAMARINMLTRSQEKAAEARNEGTQEAKERHCSDTNDETEDQAPR
jgi:hypothetical protein